MMVLEWWWNKRISQHRQQIYQQHIDANIVLYYTGSIDEKTVYIGGSHTKPILGYTLWFS